ncbi:TPA: LLM class flavin-dependent oxidoreductase [Candidatus Scatousia excrementigallinarum]|uniref:LLM class flavin-dependent oxidoreductase n=1 Tax=Candidatus Scatousia excrementigallinarum TaxID=2840935 RepID=A0A9D1JN49_9BACT|nr:LLM class flavin-dependent oxidoreductase [Candidatus Scatousia excrementigallinarum]
MEAKSAREVVKILLMKNKVSLSMLAKMLSTEDKKVYQQSLSAKLINGTLKYNEMVQICELLGYEIEFKKL